MLSAFLCSRRVFPSGVNRENKGKEMDSFLRCELPGNDDPPLITVLDPRLMSFKEKLKLQIQCTSSKKLLVANYAFLPAMVSC